MKGRKRKEGENEEMLMSTGSELFSLRNEEIKPQGLSGRERNMNQGL
jgi:hypothetical protein